MSSAKSTSPRRKRVLLLMPTMSSFGGTERILSTLSTILQESFDVYEASFEKKGTTPAFRSGARFVPLGEVSELPLPLRTITYARQARLLNRFVKENEIDIVISHLWRADLINILSRSPAKKVACLVVNISGHEKNRMLLRLKELSGAVYRKFDAVVSISETLASEVNDLFRLDPACTSVIYPVIHPPATGNESKAQALQLVWCGRFVWEKNVNALAEIIAGLKRKQVAASLVMIGDGGGKSDFISFARKLGLTVGPGGESAPDILLAGAVSDEEKFRLIAASHLMLLPSLSEGLGMVLVEAMVKEVPVLAADCPCGGVSEVLGLRHDPARTVPARSDVGVLMPMPKLEERGSVETWIETISELETRRASDSKMGFAWGDQSRRFLPEHARDAWRTLCENVLAS